jgi:hypothetical protein
MLIVLKTLNQLFQMKFSKYKKPFTYFIIYFLTFLIVAIIFLILGESSQISSFILVNNLMLEIMMILTIFCPLAAMIGSLVGTYLMSPLFLFIQKKVIGSEYEYGIEHRPGEDRFTKSFRGFFGALLAINFSLIFAFNEKIAEAVLYNEQSGGASAAFIVLLIFTSAAALILFAPVWSLLDSGIVYSNEIKLKDSDQPIEVRSIGGFYKNLLKGYASIGVVLSFYQFFANIVSAELASEAVSLADLLSASLILIPFPILLTIAFIPAIILLDILRTQRINYVRKWAKFFGINEVVDVKIDKLKSNDYKE